MNSFSWLIFFRAISSAVFFRKAELISDQSSMAMTGRSTNKSFNLAFLTMGMQPSSRASQVRWQSSPAPCGLRTNWYCDCSFHVSLIGSGLDWKKQSDLSILAKQSCRSARSMEKCQLQNIFCSLLANEGAYSAIVLSSSSCRAGKIKPPPHSSGLDHKLCRLMPIGNDWSFGWSKSLFWANHFVSLGWDSRESKWSPKEMWFIGKSLSPVTKMKESVIWGRTCLIKCTKPSLGT